MFWFLFVLFYSNLYIYLFFVEVLSTIQYYQDLYVVYIIDKGLFFLFVYVLGIFVFSSYIRILYLQRRLEAFRSYDLSIFLDL